MKVMPKVMAAIGQLGWQRRQPQRLSGGDFANELVTAFHNRIRTLENRLIEERNNRALLQLLSRDCRTSERLSDDLEESIQFIERQLQNLRNRLDNIIPDLPGDSQTEEHAVAEDEGTAPAQTAGLGTPAVSLQANGDGQMPTSAGMSAERRSSRRWSFRVNFAFT